VPDKCLQRIYCLLLASYGPRGWWPLAGRYHPGRYDYPLNDAQRFEICVGAILTQNTAWKNVELALRDLRRARMLSPKRIIDADEKTIAKLIRPAGYFNQKAQKLKIFAPHFLDWKGRTPTREQLLAIWGVGRETADSMLLYGYHKPIFVVDAYTRRLTGRLGLLPREASYDANQELFMQSLPHNYRLFNEYHALIVEHAKRHCAARPRCEHCPLARFCHSTVQKYI
jgi:endonuclease III related protein